MVHSITEATTIHRSRIKLESTWRWREYFADLLIVISFYLRETVFSSGEDLARIDKIDTLFDDGETGRPMFLFVLLPHRLDQTELSEIRIEHH